MNNKINYIFLMVAFLIKFVISLMVTNWTIALVYSVIVAFVYFRLISKKLRPGRFIPFVMLDFIVSFYLCYKSYGLDLHTILISLIYFIFSSSGIYFFIIDWLAKDTSSFKLSFSSNMEVDKGIKALEENDYEKALESFSKAIKDYKRNYLGYMGMCTTLSKMDKKNLKKINYYRKKCLKYAPRELRESITKKYD